MHFLVVTLELTTAATIPYKLVSVADSLKTVAIGTLPCSTTALTEKQEELRLLINSRSPIITVETGEEERFMKLLAAGASDLSVAWYAWSVTEGLAKFGGAALYNSDQREREAPEKSSGSGPKTLPRSAVDR